MVWWEMSPTRERTSGPPGSWTPATRALPDVGLSRPASTRRRVVLPAPFGPKRARHSPAASENVTPKLRASSTTSTIGGDGLPAGIAEDIRLELATLARATQKAISLRLRQCGDDQPL